jgi:Nucleotidyl transferase AbiEii toxin, Type IV TA system
MLHTETVEPGTLSLLKELLLIPELSSFYLVGGTALSLMYGHRISVDLDLFSGDNFDNQHIAETLSRHFGNEFAYEGGYSRFGLFSYIRAVKVDMVYYKHERIAEPYMNDGVRMYAVKDIIAMKIQAILGRGKKKDFWDIAELLNHFTINDMIECHKTKFPSQQLLISIPQALSYFTDADESEDPVSLKGQSWEWVKKIIREKVREYLS